MTALRETAVAVTDAQQSGWYAAAMERLVGVVQELSLARDLEAIMAIVRLAARDLIGADGATFVLRDGDKCFYADENAISPLWKGQRFPMRTCISGWVMLNAVPVILADIYLDPRIPADAYRPTFVKSLAMVPIRAAAPVGAIGCYWASNRETSRQEVAILQMLANFASVAMENVELYAQLRNKVDALQKSNEELASFAWAASHDLKTPLRGIDNLSAWIEEDIGVEDPDKIRAHARALRGRVERMENLLDSVLEYASVEHILAAGDEEVATGTVLAADLAELVDVPAGFAMRFGEAFAGVVLPRVPAQRIFANLIGNAFKHHDGSTGFVEIDVAEEGPNHVFIVRDDGPGIPAAHRDRIFAMFQTLSPRDLKGGSGLGLPLVRKILSVYGGDIELVASEGDRGAAFRLTWPKDAAGSAVEAV